MRDQSRRACRRRAFTLLELLLALALLGLVSTLFITGGRELFRAREFTAADVFWQAVQAARLQAIQGGATVILRYDEQSRRIVWGAAGESQSLDWPARNLEFLRDGSRDTVLIGGRLVDTAVLPTVRFHPDGTIDRFRVQLTGHDGRVTRLELDPWTAAPVVRSTP